EFSRHLTADGVQSLVLRAGVAAPVAVEAGERLGGATLERAAEDVLRAGWHDWCLEGEGESSPSDMIAESWRRAACGFTSALRSRKRLRRVKRAASPSPLPAPEAVPPATS